MKSFISTYINNVVNSWIK